MSSALDIGLSKNVATDAAQTIAFEIHGPILRADLPGLTERVCALLRRSGAGGRRLRGPRGRAGCGHVDALARLQLAARRYACPMRLRGASDDLRSLVAFMGLADVLVE